MRRLWWVLLCSCAAPVASAPVVVPPLVAKVRRLTEEVAKTRGWQARELVVETVSEDVIRATVAAEGLRAGAVPDGDERTIFGEVFGEPEPVSEALFAPTAVAVVYDSARDRLLVKDGTTDADPRILFAREIARALQPSLVEALSVDGKLALQSLRRGDAMLTMLADAHAQKPDTQLVVLAERTRLFMGTQTDEGLLDATGMSRGLMAAPHWLRGRVLFPDTAGFSFVAALHRTDGFKLVDGAFKTPPASTEQILHPELYVADERPVQIAAPRVPSGTTLVATTTLGELGLRTLLSKCVPLPRARAVGEGWGGDVLVVAQKDKTRVLALSSAWDTEDDAKEAEGALRELGGCWMKAATTTSFLVARRGNDVAFVSGLADEAAKVELVALLSLERTRAAASPPFGQKLLAPPIVLPESAPDKRGTAKDGVFTHPRFGVTLALPEGYSTNTTLPGAELLLRGGRQSASSGVFTASKTAWNKKNQEDLFTGVSAMFAQQMGAAAHLTVTKDGPVTLLGKTGRERIYGVDQTQVSIRVVIVPICDEKWLLAFFASSVSETDRVALDNWIGSVREKGGTPPVCSE